MLVAHYEHLTANGARYTAVATQEILAKSVVADLVTSKPEYTTDEEIFLDGRSSRWAAAAQPVVEWTLDGLPFDYCNPSTPPSSPQDVACTLPPGLLGPDTHEVELHLSDPATGDADSAAVSFTIIQIVPLSIDFEWDPPHPDPDQRVYFTLLVQPPQAVADLEYVTWDFGDGEPEVVNCALVPVCTMSSHVYPTDAIYHVTITAMTTTETAQASHDLTVGNPPAPPVASFSVTPTTPVLLEAATFSFTGACNAPSCTYGWDFGDSSTSTLENPTHTFSRAVPHAVTLSVSNSVATTSASMTIDVAGCWSPSPMTAVGHCYGAPITLVPPLGSQYFWSTGATTATIVVSQPGLYWVDVNNGSACWGYSELQLELDACVGDPRGDTDLDGDVDAMDLLAEITELTDGDGGTVPQSGGGDLRAPGADVAGFLGLPDGWITVEDQLAVIEELFAAP